MPNTEIMMAEKPASTTDPMELMQLAAMNINGLSQQMGLINKTVTAIRDDVSKLHAEMADAKADIRGLKDDQFVDIIKYLKVAAGTVSAAIRRGEIRPLRNPDPEVKRCYVTPRILAKWVNDYWQQ